MPVFRKSSSNQNNIMPYIRSASSKLSITTALSSTSSLSALFSSSLSTTSGSSKSIFTSGITRDRIILNENSKNQGNKENTLPSPSPSPTPTPSPSSTHSFLKRVARTRKEKSKKGGEYPEISAPQMTAESLEAVRARFTLMPLKSGPCTDEVDVVIVDEVDYQDMPAPLKKGRTA